MGDIGKTLCVNGLEIQNPSVIKFQRYVVAYRYLHLIIIVPLLLKKCDFSSLNRIVYHGFCVYLQTESVIIMERTMTFNQVWQSIQSMPLRSKRMLSKRLAESIREQDDDKEYVSKKEILAGIDAGLKDVKAGRTQDAWAFLKELEDESED